MIHTSTDNTHKGLKMNNYQNKTVDELQYIMKDASEAAKCAQMMGDAKNECRYLDQVNDAATELYKRRNAI